MGDAARAVGPLGVIRPMLATPGGPPDGDGWAVEFKWDGSARVCGISQL